MSAVQFKHVYLWGGGMKVDLPEFFVDASDFRQIPDHQEVYLDSTGKASIVLEVVERVEDAADDLEAMHVHLKDIVDPKDRLNFWWEAPITLPKLRDGIPAYSLLATVHPAPPENFQADHTHIMTGILLMMIRIEEHGTDVLVTINVPHHSGHYDELKCRLVDGLQGELLDRASVWRDRIAETLEVVSLDFLR